MKHSSQLTLEQRYGIYTLLKIGYSQTEIAKVLGVHKSTISRELIRNRGGRGYRHKQAHTFAEDRKKSKVCPRIDGWFSVSSSTLQKEKKKVLWVQRPTGKP